MAFDLHHRLHLHSTYHPVKKCRQTYPGKNERFRFRYYHRNRFCICNRYDGYNGFFDGSYRCIGVTNRLNFVISWSTVNIMAINGVVRSSTTHMLYDGEMIERNIKKERVTESELLASFGKEGVHSI